MFQNKVLNHKRKIIDLKINYFILKLYFYKYNFTYLLRNRICNLELRSKS